MIMKTQIEMIIDAMQDALLIKNKTSQADFVRRHSDDLRTDAYYGNAKSLELEVVSYEKALREAIEAAKSLAQKHSQAKLIAQKNAGHRLMQVANPFRQILNILK